MHFAAEITIIIRPSISIILRMAGPATVLTLRGCAKPLYEVQYLYRGPSLNGLRTGLASAEHCPVSSTHDPTIYTTIIQVGVSVVQHPLINVTFMLVDGIMLIPFTLSHVERGAISQVPEYISLFCTRRSHEVSRKISSYCTVHYSSQPATVEQIHAIWNINRMRLVRAAVSDMEWLWVYLHALEGSCNKALRLETTSTRHNFRMCTHSRAFR
jgi:hypothetical protein